MYSVLEARLWLWLHASDMKAILSLSLSLSLSLIILSSKGDSSDRFCLSSVSSVAAVRGLCFLSFFRSLFSLGASCAFDFLGGDFERRIS